METIKNIIIPLNKETPYFPEVNFEFDKGECTIKGESYMEDCYKFYNPLIEWLEKYCELRSSITFNFHLYYFNTQSSRMILKLFEILMKFKEKGGQVNINWYYYSSDPDMVEEVEDFQRESGLDVNLIEING